MYRILKFFLKQLHHSLSSTVKSIHPSTLPTMLLIHASHPRSFLSLLSHTYLNWTSYPHFQISDSASTRRLASWRSPRIFHSFSFHALLLVQAAKEHCQPPPMSSFCSRAVVLKRALIIFLQQYQGSAPCTILSVTIYSKLATNYFRYK